MRRRAEKMSDDLLAALLFVCAAGILGAIIGALLVFEGRF